MGDRLRQSAFLIFLSLTCSLAAANESCGTLLRAHLEDEGPELAKIAQQSIADLKPLLNKLDQPLVTHLTVGKFKHNKALGFDPQTLTIDVKAALIGQNSIESNLQYAYAYAVFTANMAHHDPHWKYWYEQVVKSQTNEGLQEILFKFRPHRLIRISYPYQKLFAEMLVRIHHQESNVQNFKLMDTAKVLWSKYLKLEKNRGREAEFLKILFDTIAEEIVERSQSEALKAIEHGEMNIRLLNKLVKSLKGFE